MSATPPQGRRNANNPVSEEDLEDLNDLRGNDPRLKSLHPPIYLDQGLQDGMQRGPDSQIVDIHVLVLLILHCDVLLRSDRHRSTRLRSPGHRSRTALHERRPAAREHLVGSVVLVVRALAYSPS